MKTIVYEDDVEIKVFFNMVAIPAIIGVLFDSFYATFIAGLFMFMVYEFMIMDNYYELYSKEELQVKRNTLLLSYVMYAIFLFTFWQDIANYIKG